MTIDEVIAFCEEKANNIKLKAEPQVFIQIAEWLEELKSLRLLLDWAIECDFGLDSFPDEYEKYKCTLNDGMSYTEQLKQIARCVVAEQLKAGGEYDN